MATALAITLRRWPPPGSRRGGQVEGASRPVLEIFGERGSHMLVERLIE
jgi:hypothetical protein